MESMPELLTLQPFDLIEALGPGKQHIVERRRTNGIVLETTIHGSIAVHNCYGESGGRLCHAGTKILRQGLLFINVDWSAL
jgi:hypothetical protein